MSLKLGRAATSLRDQSLQNHDIRAFVGSANPLVKDLLARVRNFGEASDILRIAIVHEFGGIYTDWDIYLLDLTAIQRTFFRIWREWNTISKRLKNFLSRFKRNYHAFTFLFRAQKAGPAVIS
jgi:hypothetical protein